MLKLIWYYWGRFCQWCVLNVFDLPHKDILEPYIILDVKCLSGTAGMLTDPEFKSHRKALNYNFTPSHACLSCLEGRKQKFLIYVLPQIPILIDKMSYDKFMISLKLYIFKVQYFRICWTPKCYLFTVCYFLMRILQNWLRISCLGGIYHLLTNIMIQLILKLLNLIYSGISSSGIIFIS